MIKAVIEELLQEGRVLVVTYEDTTSKCFVWRQLQGDYPGTYELLVIDTKAPKLFVSPADEYPTALYNDNVALLPPDQQATLDTHLNEAILYD